MVYLLNRQALAAAGVDQQTIEALAKAKQSAEQSEGEINTLKEASVVLLAPSGVLPKGRTLNAGSGLDLEDGGAGNSASLSLSDTTVSPGTYGAESRLVRITVDQKGRITHIEAIDLVSDNVAEGETNLFFTEARSRGSLSAGDGIVYGAETGIIAVDPAVVVIPEYGTWTPTDASPDALAFTIVRAAYARIGQLVTVEAEITYPATASANGAALTGLPFAPAGTGAGSYYAGTAAGALFQTGGNLYPATAAGAAVQNSQLSGATVSLTYTYSVEVV